METKYPSERLPYMETKYGQPPEVPVSPPMTLVSVTTKANHPNLKKFRHSMGLANFRDLRVVGIGVKWRNTRTKVELFMQELARMADTDIFVGIDCFDVLAQRIENSEARLMELFNNMNSGLSAPQVIVSGESGGGSRTHFSNKRYFIARPDVPKTLFCHENGGFIMGRAQDVRAMFQFCLDNVNEKKINKTTDQYGIGLYAARYPERVRFDTHQEFCGCIVGNELRLWRRSPAGFYREGFAPPPFMHVPHLKSKQKREAFDTIWRHLHGKPKSAKPKPKRKPGIKRLPVRPVRRRRI